MLSDTYVQHMYLDKSIDTLKNSDVEIFVDEWVKVENQEVVYTDRMVKVLFSEDDLFDPCLINEQVLEESPLGSMSSYRNKAMVRIGLNEENLNLKI